MTRWKRALTDGVEFGRATVTVTTFSSALRVRVEHGRREASPMAERERARLGWRVDVKGLPR